MQQFLGVAKRTLYRLIREGKIPSVNLGTCLLETDRKIIAEMFAIFHTLPESENKLKKKLYRLKKEDCYFISEIAERFQISEGSVDSHIRKYSISTRQSGKYVYAAKMEIDNFCELQKF